MDNFLGACHECFHPWFLRAYGLYTMNTIKVLHLFAIFLIFVGAYVSWSIVVTIDSIILNVESLMYTETF